MSFPIFSGLLFLPSKASFFKISFSKLHQWVVSISFLPLSLEHSPIRLLPCHSREIVFIKITNDLHFLNAMLSSQTSSHLIYLQSLTLWKSFFNNRCCLSYLLAIPSQPALLFFLWSFSFKKLSPLWASQFSRSLCLSLHSFPLGTIIESHDFKCYLYTSRGQFMFLSLTHLLSVSTWESNEHPKLVIVQNWGPVLFPTNLLVFFISGNRNSSPPFAYGFSNLWHVVLSAPWHVESSQTQDWASVLHTGKWIPSFCTTREVWAVL